MMHAPAPDVKQRQKLEGGKRFVLHTEFEAAGDQPTAIAELSEAIKAGERNQVLLGATGTGKTFTMAKVIEETSARQSSSPPTRPSPRSFTEK